LHPVAPCKVELLGAATLARSVLTVQRFARGQMARNPTSNPGLIDFASPIDRTSEGCFERLRGAANVSCRHDKWVSTSVYTKSASAGFSSSLQAFGRLARCHAASSASLADSSADLRLRQILRLTAFAALPTDPSPGADYRLDFSTWDDGGMDRPNNARFAGVSLLFRRALRFATSMEQQERPPYWRAYGRGLRRGFEGDSRVSDYEHIRLIRIDGTDTSRGYRDGIRYGESLREGRDMLLCS
jgi:hypothetical protein